jgi:hypothetical protein
MSRKSKIGKQFKSFKWILLFCSATIFMSCSNTVERKNFGLNGNVKSYFERLYEVEKKFGKWENGDIEYYGHSRVTFDKDGQYREIENYDDDMDLTGKLLPVREKEKVLEEIYYGKDGQLQSKTIILHISTNEIDFESFDSDGKKTAHGKTIRKNGKVMKQVYITMRNNGEDETYTTLFEYDKDGNLISQKQTNEKGEIEFYFRFEYLEFDAKKNWTKRLTYEDEDEPKNIAIREIEYY